LEVWLLNQSFSTTGTNWLCWWYPLPVPLKTHYIIIMSQISDFIQISRHMCFPSIHLHRENPLDGSCLVESRIGLSTPIESHGWMCGKKSTHLGTRLSASSGRIGILCRIASLIMHTRYASVINQIVRVGRVRSPWSRWSVRNPFNSMNSVSLQIRRHQRNASLPWMPCTIAHNPSWLRRVPKNRLVFNLPYFRLLRSCLIVRVGRAMPSRTRTHVPRCDGVDCVG
jgi:hypothetical protein